MLTPLHLGRRLDHVAQRGPVREQVEVLEHHPHVAALLGDLARLHLVQLAAPLVIADQGPVDVEPAGADRLQVVDTAQERRLAGTRRPDAAPAPALLYFQGDALEHLECAEVLADQLGLHHGVSGLLGRHAQVPICALASASSCLVVSLRDAPLEK